MQSQTILSTDLGKSAATRKTGLISPATTIGKNFMIGSEGGREDVAAQYSSVTDAHI